MRGRGFICECKHCKKTFTNNVRSYTCPDCKELDEQIFDRIIEYLGQYPNSNTLNIAEALDLKASLILKYVDEGKLVPVHGRFERI